MKPNTLNSRRLALPILSCLAASGLACHANHLDLFTWDQLASPTTNNLAKITYAKSAFWAVGSGGTILRSSNGFDWVVIPSPTTNDLSAVAYENNLFVAAGDKDTILTSANGTEWTLRLSNLNQTGRRRSIAFGNGKFVVARGDNNGVLISTNGSDWVDQVVPTVSTGIEGVTFANGMFFASGGDFFVGSRIYRSLDALEWQTVTNWGTSVALNGIRNVGGQLIADGANGFIARSEDAGTTWTEQVAVPTCPNCQGVFDVVFGDGRFVLLASSSLWTSVSGNGWSYGSDFPTTNNGGVAYGNGAFITVGGDGRIFRSRSRLQLSIEQAATNVVLSWPSSSHAVTVERAPMLNGLWSPAPGGPVTVGAKSVLTNAIEPGSMFFRLRFDE